MGERMEASAVATKARMRRFGVLLALSGAVALIAPGAASAHIERDPVFVDAAADTSVYPAAGGDFVRYREPSRPASRIKLFRRYARSAWVGGVSSRQRETIQADYRRLTKSQQRRARGFLRDLRRARGGRGPTVAALGLGDVRSSARSEKIHVACRPDSMRRLERSIRSQRMPASRAAHIRSQNRRWRRNCRYREIQPAVNAARNNDIVIIMPGFYTEPTARAQPHNDPTCADLVETTETGRTGAPSYAYHVKCPNDLNLIALIGRDLDGKCIRCNVQIEGSGARPEDVIIEGGIDVPDPGVKADLFDRGKGPAKPAKEVGIRVERADGTYLRNFTVRNVEEHGVYGIETDGMTTSKVKAFYGIEYGFLTFVTDHNLMKHLEAAGSADAGLYPGASPPTRPRMNTILTKSKSYNNALGFSGTMGSNVEITDNDFFDNSAGISLDSFYQAGHPGFPQHNTKIRKNRIHSNNFDTYSENAWVKSTVPAPVGVGILFAGGNDNLVTGNHIYDNWRWGTVLITVPDALSNQFEQTPSGDDAKLSTSHRNRQEGNVMGVSMTGEKLPNGLDFWWDELGQGNCWQHNGPGSIKSDPPSLPDCAAFPNQGTGRPDKEAHLAACGFAPDRSPGNPTCDWFQVPPRPQSSD